MDKYAVVSVKVGDDIYLLSDAKGIVNGFASLRDALDKFENLYGRGHARGFEGSASACIHFISFQTKCHEPLELQSLMPSVVKPYANIRSVRGMAGSITGILCEGPDAHAWHESGVAPDLAAQIR